MRALLFLLVLFVASGSRSAEASDQVLNYELLLDGKSVGKRQVELRYLPPPPGELDQSRMIRSTLELEVVVARQAYRLNSRVSALHGPSGTNLSASVMENGQAREIQARAEPDGSWSVTGLESGARTTWTFERSAVVLSSMELLDPERYLRVLDRTASPMLIAENGQVATGQVEDMGEVQIEVAGE